MLFKEIFSIFLGISTVLRENVKIIKFCGNLISRYLISDSVLGATSARTKEETIFLPIQRFSVSEETFYIGCQLNKLASPDYNVGDCQNAIRISETII